MSKEPNIIQLGYAEYRPVNLEEYNIMIDYFSNDTESLENYILNYYPSEKMRLFIADIIKGKVKRPNGRYTNIRAINTIGFWVLRLLGEGFNQTEAIEVVSEKIEALGPDGREKLKLDRENNHKNKTDKKGYVYPFDRIKKIVQEFKKHNSKWSFITNKQKRKTNPEVLSYREKRQR